MDDANSTIGMLSLITLILIDALTSAAHSSLVNAHKQNLRDLVEEERPFVSKRAKRVLDLSENSTRLLASRQFISTMLHFLAVGIATIDIAQPAIRGLSESNPNLSHVAVVGGIYGVTWFISAMLMIIFGELIPSTLATKNAERFSMLIVGPMEVLLKLTAPISGFVIWLGVRMASPFGKTQNTYVTEEEIKTLVDAGSEEGVIEVEEKAMIYSIMEFGDTVAREIMVPRIDIIAAGAETPLQEAVDMVLKNGHSRIPVYEDSIDKIIGLLYAKDLLSNLRNGEGQSRPVREIIRPAYFVPESKKAGALLEELQERKIHMAIVIDEYGGTAGLVTIEDLLEEIVGEIQDEYDYDEEAEFEKINENEYVFDAGIAISDVNDLLDVELPTEDSDTLGGFIYSSMGKVPLAGESFRSDNLEVRVEIITGRRIRKVRVIRHLPPTEEPENQAEKPAEKQQSENNAETPPPTQSESDLNSSLNPSDPLKSGAI